MRDIQYKSRARERGFCIGGGHVDIPHDARYLLPLNKWSANVPGTTYSPPIAELPALYINIMMILIDTVSSSSSTSAR